MRRRLNDVTIVIPQFNRSELTLACLESLRRHESELPPIFVVDDGSRPEHRRPVIDAARQGRQAATVPVAGSVRDSSSGVRLFAQLHAGVTAAWNRGLAAVEAPFVVFLNNDTLARGPFVAHLLEPLRDEKSVMTGVGLRRETALPFNLLARLPSQWFLEGWCLAARTDDLRRIGGFDENMKLYFSDTDVQARLLREPWRGTKALAVVADLPLEHLGHGSTRQRGDRRRQWHADRAEFIRKWDSSIQHSAFSGQRSA